jgi:catechol 2,3-dioxygenase-like lactoylglutathione lyase family enzyme
MSTSRAQDPSPRFEAVTPRIPVADVESALDFYVGKLGFELGWKWGSPPTHANVCRDSISLDLITTPPQRQGTAMAYVQVRGVDAYHSELRTRGIPLGDLGDRDYGMRDFEIVDPSGNRIAFGEPAGSDSATQAR